MKKFASTFNPKAFLLDFVKATGAIPTLLWFRPKKIYEEGRKVKKYYNGRYICTANHSSYLDPVIMFTCFWMRRPRFLTTKAIMDLPFWGKFFKACGCIEVNKQSFAFHTIKEAKKTLDDGYIVGVFPEGTVNRENDLLAFKTGTATMAAMYKADIVPVYIAPKKKWYERQVLVMGKRIKISEYIKGQLPTRDEILELTNVLREKEEKLKDLVK